MPSGFAIDAEMGEPTGVRRGVIAAVFATSGGAALVYQVAWQRILAFPSGVGIYSVAMIVSAFMAGLGLGSWAGARLSQRCTRAAALRAFAAIELAVGLFALVSCHLYYDVLYLDWPGLYRTPWAAGLLHFAALLVPTGLMGMSLPFLVQAVVGSPATASRTIGFFYGMNVIGAALGALMAPWLLIRLYGIEGAVEFGASGNLSAGLIVLALGAAPESQPAAERPPPPAGLEPAGSRPFAMWVGLYGLSGFCALALEILWFRIIDVAVKSTAFTFGTVLAIFLLGLASGSLWSAQPSARIRRPLRAFLTCQCALLAYAGAAVWLLAAAPVDAPLYRDLVSYWSRYDGLILGTPGEGGEALLLYVLLPLLLYGPPTFLMGVSFTVLQRAVHDDRRTSGRKVGVLQSANIAGNVAGSLLVGLVLLDLVGTAGSLRVLLAAGVVFAGIGCAVEGSLRRFGSWAALLVALAFGLPSNDALWRRLVGDAPEPVFVEEDATAVVTSTPGDRGQMVSVNGKGHSWIPYGGVHSVLGAVPAAMHPAPERIAIIGLGSGDTAWAASFRDETRRITVFELVRPELRLLERIAERLAPADLLELLGDSRVRVVHADGRNALLQGEERYDVIEIDALRPYSAFAGNLYSTEFFRLAARRLEPGGLLCAWVPTRRAQNAFLEAFEHVVGFDDQVLVGSNEPLALEPRRWAHRLRAARRHFGPELADEIAGTFRRTHRPAAFDGLAPDRDLFPRDEFQSPVTADPRDDQRGASFRSGTS